MRDYDDRLSSVSVTMIVYIDILQMPLLVSAATKNPFAQQHKKTALWLMCEQRITASACAFFQVTLSSIYLQYPGALEVKKLKL